MTSTTDIQLSDEFIAFFNKLEKVPDTTLRLFDRGNLFTLHSKDAQACCDLYLKSRSLLKYYKNNPYVVIKKENSDFFRFFLLKKHYKIQIYTQSSGKVSDFELEFEGSPGNLDDLTQYIGQTDNDWGCSVIASLIFKVEGDSVKISFSSYNNDENSFKYCEFTDSFELCNLESVLLQSQANECIIIKSSLEQDSVTSQQIPEISIVHFQNTVARLNLLVSELAPASFDYDESFSSLKHIVNDSSDSSHGIIYKIEKENKTCIRTLGSIIKYLLLNSDPNLQGKVKIEAWAIESFMRIDCSALQSLNLLPNIDDHDKNCSLFGILNKCKTNQGQRLLNQWIRQPLTDPNFINERLDLVEIFKDDFLLLTTIHDEFLGSFPDLLRLSKLMQKKSSALESYYKLYVGCSRISNALNVLRQYTGRNEHILKSLITEKLEKEQNIFSTFCQMIETSLDMKTILEKREYNVSPHFDEDLGELKSKNEEIEESIEKIAQRTSREMGLEFGKGLKLEYADQTGFYLRITKKEERALREMKGYYIMDAPNNIVRFRNVKIEDLSDTYATNKREYSKIQSEIIVKIMETANTYLEPIFRLNNLTAFIDVIASFAIVAKENLSGYVRPRVIDLDSEYSNQVLNIKNGRHSCLEMLLTAPVIPNDCFLKRGEQICKIITGPNMGGKSTYLRQVGLMVIMAQIGSFVPAEEMVMTPFDSVLTRIGANDCQARGISTFYAEMLESSAAIKCATKKSLVLVDELGRGTSTYDGFGLAWSIANYLSDEESLGCFTLYATHFHELTLLENEKPNVIANYSVAAEIDESQRICMMYKVVKTPCKKSYGIEIAKLANLPDEIINDANEVLKEDEKYERAIMAANEFACKNKAFDGWEKKYFDLITNLSKENIDSNEKKNKLTKLATGGEEQVLSLILNQLA